MPRAQPVRPNQKPPVARRWQHQMREPLRTDPYRTDMKPRGIVLCKVCKSVNLRGDWISAKEALLRDPPVTGETRGECPACRQARDHYAQGVVEVHGAAWRRVRREVLRNIEKTEEIVRSRNDQERILWTEDTRGGVFKIYVTLPELARQIGRELERGFKGSAEYRRSSEEPFLRVYWWSDLPHFRHEPGAPIGLKRPSRAGRSTRTVRSGKSSAFRGRSARQ